MSREERATWRSCWGGSEQLRSWAAAVFVGGVLLYAGISWIPPRSPAAPPVESVLVAEVLEVRLRVAPRVNVNQATPRELEELPGIGPVLARRIVEYRTEQGPFCSPGELTAVRGIGPSTVEELHERITVE